MTSADPILPRKVWPLFIGAMLFVLAIYLYPGVRTTLTTGSRAIPPILAPDLSLYLNISNVQANNSGQILDPYYGVPVPTARMGYLKFRLAFLLFGGVNTLLHHDLRWTVFLWNLFWWALLSALALWFFDKFLPDHSPAFAVAGLMFLMLFNFGVLQSQLAAWIHLPSVHSFQGIELPYIRSFFPQVPTPLLLLYLGFQIRALQKNNLWYWAAMAVIQFLAFAIFPYTMLMMAGITLLAVISAPLSPQIRVQWATLSIFAIACGLSDLLFFVHGGQVARTGAPGQYSLIHIQLSLLPHRIGGMWLILAALTALFLFLPNLAPEVKWPITGLCLTNLLMLLGDAFFSETALQMSHHAAYFLQLSIAVPLTFLLWAGLDVFRSRMPNPRLVTAAVIALLALNGILLSQADYRYPLAANQERADLSQVLHSDPLQADDLVIAPSLVVDDDCAWVSLLTPSHSLYCRSAQVLFSPEQNQQIQRFRQALYLYFTGKDDRWVESILQNRNAVWELTRLTFLGQITTNTDEFQRNINSVRTDLVPLLIKAQNHDPEVQAFFARFPHVLVIDNAANPYFAIPRLSAYLKIESQQTYGSVRIFNCAPLEASVAAQ